LCQLLEPRLDRSLNNCFVTGRGVVIMHCSLHSLGCGVGYFGQ
jgi:hypothetical protein